MNRRPPQAIKQLSEYIKRLLPILDYFVFAVYVIVCVIATMRHEPWRDEAQVWLMVRDASLWDVFSLQLRYHRHPGLWYFLVMPLAKLGLPYISMAWLHLVVSISAVAVFLWKSPFSRLTKYAFILSYYMVYQYSILARNYSIGILLLFVIAALYKNHLKKPLRHSVFIALLFNTNHLCMPPALALTCVFIVEMIRKKVNIKFIITSVLIIGFGASIALFHCTVNPSDIVNYGTQFPHVLSPIYAMSRALFPLVAGVPEAVRFSIGAFILIMTPILWINRRETLLVCLMTLLSASYLFAYRHPGGAGYLRHYGFMLIYVLFFGWLASFKRKDSSKLSVIPRAIVPVYWLILNGCLVLSVYYGFIAHRMDYYLMFSGSKRMAAVMRSLYEEMPILKNLPVAAHTSGTASAILPYLPNQQFWYADQQAFGTFSIYNQKTEEGRSISEDEIIRRVDRAFGALPALLLLLGRPLTLDSSNGWKFRLLYQVEKGVYGYGHEVYYLYLGERLASYQGV